MKPKSALRSCLALAGSTLLAISSSHAATYYWDTNSNTAGSSGGTTASGTWSSGGTTWSTSSTGDAVTSAHTTLSTDDLFFSAGTNATGASAITLTSTQDAQSLTFEEGTATISGASGIITLGGAGGNITVNSGASAIIGNNTNTVIGGSVGLTKLGAGTLTLNGTATNTFTGGINVNGGTLALDYANIAASTDLVTSQALNFGGGNLTLKGKTGSNATTQSFGNVTVNAGGGTLLIDPNNGTSTTLTLGTLTATAAGGSLTVGKAVTANTGTVAITTTTDMDATGIYGGRIVFANGTANTGYDWATNTGGGGPNYTLSAYGGYSALNLTAGTDTLNSRITASQTLGGARVTNSLKIENPAASQTLALGSNLLTLTSGGLLVTGTNAVSITGTAGATRLTAGNGSGAYDLVVHQYNSGGLNIGAVIGNNGGNATTLTKAGTGTLTLSGNNTFTGGLVINGGTVAMTVNQSFTGGITINSGTLSFGVSGSNTNVVNTGNAITFAGSGAITAPNGQVFNQTFASGTINSGAVATYNTGTSGSSAHTLTFTGGLSGSGDFLIRSGNIGQAKTTNLGNSSSFTGTISVGYSSSSTNVLNLSGLGDGGLLQITGGNMRNGLTVNYTGATQTFNTRQLQFDASASFDNGMTINSDGSGALIFNTDLSVTSTASATAKTLTLGGNYAATSNAFNGSIPNGTTAVINLTKSGGGTWILGGTNTFTGGTSVTAGTLKLNNNLALQNSLLTLGAGTLTFETGITTPTIGGLSGSANLATIFTSGYNNVTALTLNPQTGVSGTYSGVISNGSGAMTLTKTGLGTQILTGPNTYTGTTTVTNGVLNLGGAETAGVSGPLGNSAAANPGSIVLSGGTLQHSAANTNDYSGRFSTAASQQYKVDTNGQNVTWATALTSSGGTLTKIGNGTLTLSGPNTYSGGSTISGGTLLFLNTDAKAATGTHAFAAGTTLGLGVATSGSFFNSTDIANALSGTMTGNLSNVTVTATTNVAVDTSQGDFIYSDSVLSNPTKSLTKLGANTLTLSGANTYTGATTISNGTLSLTGSLANTAISTSGSGILNQSAAGVISGTSSFTQGTAGTSVLAGTNTYTGATTISNGTLSLTGSLASSAISTSGTGILNQSAAGVISGTSSFTQGSSGTSILAGTNTYTGATTITTGTLNANSSAALGSAFNTLVFNGGTLQAGGTITSAATRNVTMTGAGTIDTNSNAVSIAGIISGAGNLTKTGAGTLTLSAANTFSGTTTATAGNITLNNALALQSSPLDTTGAGTITLGTEHCGDPITTLTLGGLTDSGTTRNLATVITNYNTLTALTLNLGTGSTQTYDGIIGEGATGMDLTKSGAGTQILTGANTYTGTTAIDNGTLTLSGAAGAIASSTAITINRGTLNLINADNDTEDGLNRIKDDAAITSNGGTLNYTTTTAASARNFIETIGSVSLATGQLNVVQTLNKSAGSQTLALSGLSQAGTGSITFSNPGGLNLTNDRIRVDGITTDTTAGQIIGAYATLGTTAASQTDYAVYDSDGTDGYIAGANIAASGESTWTTAGNAYTANAGAAAGGSTGLTATRTITALKSISGANAVTADNTTDRFTLASNTFANGDAFILGGTAPTGLTSGNTYYVINKSGDTFQLSTSVGGAASLFSANGTSVTATGAITLSTGNNLETYGLLNGVATTMHVRANGTGAVTTPTGGGSLHVNAGAGAIQMNAPITNNGGNVTLVKNGSGALTLGVSSTFSGGLVLNAGNLTLSVAQGISGDITLNGGDVKLGLAGTNALLSSASSLIFAGNATINPAGGNSIHTLPTVVINNGATAQFNAITGATTTYTLGGLSGSGNLNFGGGTTANASKVLNLGDASGFTGNLNFSTTNGGSGTPTLSFSAMGDGNKIQYGSTAFGLAINYTGSGTTFNTRQLEMASTQSITLNSNGTGGLVFNQSLSVTGAGGKTLTLSGTPSGGAVFNNAFNGQIGNGAGTIALAKTGASIWNVTNAYNSYTGGTIVNGGTLGFANGALGSSGTINASGGTLLWLAGNTQDISSRLAMTAATDSTFHTNGNDVNFASAIGSATTGRLVKTGLGTLTLNGLNTYTGSTTLNAGKLKLNYDTGTGGVNDSKLSNTASTGTLLLNGGTLELSGGSHVETVLSTTLNTGGTFITQPTGTSTLSMGAITFTGGAIDFAEDSIATTSSGVTNGILSQRATVAGANFAMKSGSNIVAYDYVGANGSTGYTGGAMSANINYAMQTAGGANTLAATTGATTNTLKIANTATGSLAVGANTLTVGAILFAGSADYDITTSGAGKIVPSLLHNYGTGGATLTLGALGGALTQFGTGTTILNDAATTAGGLTVNGGTVQISNNNQIGLVASGTGITLNNGTVLASETLALNNAGANHRAITLGAGGGTLAAADTKTLTVSGVISGAGALTVGAASSAGNVTLSGTNTYSGDTTVSVGTLLVSGSIGGSAVTVTGTDTILATDAAASFGSTVTINNGAILAAGGAAAAGTATVSGGTTFNNDSIFSWDISANGATYDKVITPTLAGELAAGDAIFRIVLADSTFADTFWDSNQTWTDIFTTDGTSPLTDWASVFGDSVLVVDSSFNPVAGAFTLSCNTLSYTFATIPEPTSALAGLLLGAGLLRRRRAA